MNKYIDDFMAEFKYTGLTFDDVSLVTQYADFLPNETDVSSKFTRNISLKIPFVSAAMDTVTNSEMAITLAKKGGIGVIHKNMSIEDHAKAVRRVKKHSNGLIENPVCFNVDDTIETVLNTKVQKNFNFNGFPILGPQGKLRGILTAKDLKFVNDYQTKVSDVMTKDLVTAAEGTSLDEAYKIMLDTKLGKLPLVTEDGTLIGLYSFHDVGALCSNSVQSFNLDDNYQLRCAAAMSPYDFDRAEALVDAGVDALVLDTAHGHSKGVIETVREVKKRWPQVDVVAGNVGTGEGAAALVEAGADAVKVGIGPGSICTTRVVAGVGIPQISAIYQAFKAVPAEIPIIADGGIKQSGDVAKAISVGASCVMVGSLLAGTEESPGEKVVHQGRRYVVYRGMGSLEAMKAGQGSKERYSQGDVHDPSQLIPQGVEGRVPFRGEAASVLHQYAGGLNFSLGYCGAKSIKEFQETAKLIRVTASGLKEAHPHDIQVAKDAPNYRAN